MTTCGICGGSKWVCKQPDGRFLCHDCIWKLIRGEQLCHSKSNSIIQIEENKK